MKQRNKNGQGVDTRRAGIVRYLREWPRRHGRLVHDQMVRGVSYGVGSGAVSLLIMWWQSRH